MERRQRSVQILSVIQPINGYSRAIVREDPRPAQGEPIAALHKAVSAEVGDHRPMARAAYSDLLVVAPADVNRLGSRFEGSRAVRRDVARGIVGVEAFQEDILRVAMGRGERPSHMVIVADDDKGSAR